MVEDILSILYTLYTSLQVSLDLLWPMDCCDAVAKHSRVADHRNTAMDPVRGRCPHRCPMPINTCIMLSSVFSSSMNWAKS